MLYQGEHLFIGQLGHFFALLSFIASLVATYSYFRSMRATDVVEQQSWKKIARTSFIIESIAVVSIFLTLYIIIYNHFFEYRYAQSHSKRSLEVKYLLSCFWEGQEGSFMLWNFWHCVLGLIVIRSAKQWEAPVMTIVSLVQAFIATFLVGIYFFNAKVGSSPFVLMRNEFPQAPIFQDPEYLAKYLRDGNGLNILLQNYWMVIHPPVVFLGYASATIPFAFAVSGLWTKKYGDWVKVALPWSLFNAAILGLGIMMGAAWAYESLTFGGYWAWDPVENASLVPWLVAISGVHSLLIYRSTGHSLKAAYWFSFLAFLLVVYSTFLTRTGVLGDTSVHSFTGEGNSLLWHLLAMMVMFSSIYLVSYFRNAKQIPVVKKEEEIASREFWMFVGALVFFIAALYITALTSIPIYNKLFGTKWALGEDVEYIYNRVVILITIVIGILTAITQYFKFKNTSRSELTRKLAWPTGIALLFSVLISALGGINYDKYGWGYLAAIHLAIFTSVYAVVANAGYIWTGVNGKLRSAGGSIAHVGFGLMLVGILISSTKKEVISINQTGLNVPGLKDARGRDENPMENTTLIQGVPTHMNKYVVTYVGDSLAAGDEKRYFKVHFIDKDTANGEVREEFNLYPDAFVMKSDGRDAISANPSSKHYLHKDVFTFITSMLNTDNVKDTASFRSNWVKQGDTVFYSNGFMVIDRIIAVNKAVNKDLPLVDSAWLAEVSVKSKDGMDFHLQPGYFVKNEIPIVKMDTAINQGLILQINKINGNQIDLGVKESNTVMKYITLKAFQFPFINVLWLGTLIMFFGVLIAMWRRITLNRRDTKI